MTASEQTDIYVCTEASQTTFSRLIASLCFPRSTGAFGFSCPVSKQSAEGAISTAIQNCLKGPGGVDPAVIAGIMNKAAYTAATTTVMISSSTNLAAIQTALTPGFEVKGSLAGTGLSGAQ